MGRTREEDEVACFGAAGRSRGARGGGGRGGRSGGGGGGRGGSGGGRRNFRRDDSDDDVEEDGDAFDGSDESTYRCRLCRKVGHWEQYCVKRRGEGDACYRCGKSGHQMRRCRAQVLEESSSLAVDEDDVEGFGF